jgi:uncharacterized damage-inducible protein DinB
MMDAQTIARLYDYNFWADHRTMDSCATLTTEQLLKPVGGSFGSVRNTLAHIMDVEWLYLERWQGRVPPSLPKAEDYPDLGAIRARWKDVEMNLTRYVSGLSDADLVRVVEFRNTKGILYRHPLWEMMQHLVNHSTYHRGQVATLLRMLGSSAQATDLIAFYRERSGQATQ